MTRFVPRAWLGTCLGLALSLFGCGSLNAGPSGAADAQHALLGAVAPAFDLPSADGKQRVSLAKVSGQVVVVDFWATWCIPCRQSFPAYQRLSQKFDGQAVILGISVDEEPSGIALFARETGAEFALGWDEAQTTSKQYQPPTMPTSYVLDKHGVVRFVHSGFYAGEEQQLETEIRSLLQ